MRHAVMINDLRTGLFFQRMMELPGITLHQAGSNLDEAAGVFTSGGSVNLHIREARKRGICTLHYLVSASKMGGHPQQNPIKIGEHTREEISGAGLIHVYLQAQGANNWLLRLDVPHVTLVDQADGWDRDAIENEGRRLMQLMKTFSNPPEPARRAMLP